MTRLARNLFGWWGRIQRRRMAAKYHGGRSLKAIKNGERLVLIRRPARTQET